MEQQATITHDVTATVHNMGLTPALVQLLGGKWFNTGSTLIPNTNK